MEGKIALIAGGTDGMGKAYADVMLEHKIKVCIAGRDSARGNAALEELSSKHGADRVIFCQCDVTKQDQLENLFKHTISTFGGLDIVVNQAGTVYESDWKMVVDVNITAAVQSTSLAIDYMGTHKGGKGGLVINTSSLAGLIPLDVAPHYCATRFAIVGFTRAMANISHPTYGVRMNVMCPSYVQTKLINFKKDDLEKGQLYGPDIDSRLPASVEALGPGLVPMEEITRLFMVLVKDETINGQAMVITNQGSGLASGAPNSVKELLDMHVPNEL